MKYWFVKVKVKRQCEKLDHTLTSNIKVEIKKIDCEY
jgi:hypothetical protein